MNFIWAEAITYWHVLVWSVHSCCYSDVNVRQTNTCQWSERRLCSAKNTHQRINGLEVLELPKTYLENHKMIGKCLLNVRFYRQKDLNKLYIFFCNIALTLVINSYTWNKKTIDMTLWPFHPGNHSHGNWSDSGQSQAAIFHFGMYNSSNFHYLYM